MPRRKRDIGDFRSVDLLEEVNLNERAGPLQRQNRPPRRRGEETNVEQDEEEADFHSVCPCRNCARLPRPSVRFMSIIGRHIRAHGRAPKYEVIHMAYFISGKQYLSYR